MLSLLLIPTRNLSLCTEESLQQHLFNQCVTFSDIITYRLGSYQEELVFNCFCSHYTSNPSPTPPPPPRTKFIAAQQDKGRESGNHLQGCQYTHTSLLCLNHNRRTPYLPRKGTMTTKHINFVAKEFKSVLHVCICSV